MEDHKNEQFVGVISGVTDWGIYVEIISNKCEGMVSVRDMKDDHYAFDQDQYAMVGRNTKTMYQLGDEVIVKVKNTDLVKKHLDFNLIGKPETLNFLLKEGIIIVNLRLNKKINKYETINYKSYFLFIDYSISSKFYR